MAEKKSSGIAVLLSFLIPGLGQIYNGQIGKGVLFILLVIVFGILSIVLIGIPLLLILWVYGMYNAYKTAEATNPEPPALEKSESKEKVVICPGCDAENAHGSKHCKECGKPLGKAKK